MSLDVTLRTKELVQKSPSTGVFTRTNGQTRELTEEEVLKQWPHWEPLAVEHEPSHGVFDYNITHNLGKMAEVAGLYEALWRPYRLHPSFKPFGDDQYDEEYAFEESVTMKAGELIIPLAKGLRELTIAPEKYKALNPENGWGDYEGLVAFVKAYLLACIEHPEATISISR